MMCALLSLLAGLYFSLGFFLGKFSFGFGQLLLESGVGMEASHYAGANDAPGIDIALEMVAANHSALAHLVASVQNLINAVRIDLSEHQGCGPADRGMA